MKSFNKICRSSFLAVMAFLSLPNVSLAMPDALGCKVYGEYGSAQMHSVVENGKTFLVFSNPIAWRNVTRFELVFSSGYALDQPLNLGANGANEINGDLQTVQITLNSPSPMTPTVRYGKVKAGDYRSDWYSTTGKYKEYDIQCFNF